MPNSGFDIRARELLKALEDSRQLKRFYHLTGALGPTASIEGVGEVVVLCSNNYLGLANHPEVVAAGQDGLKKYGAGTASVRFICGTLVCHRELEETIARFAGTPAVPSYVRRWTAQQAPIPMLVGPDECP